jgi:protein-S-isoprenylcysteine O-methyltransferase Ste14
VRYWFLIPLFAGFACNSTSAFTTYFSGKLGERNGRLVCIVLRDILGIPVWVVGYGLAALSSSPRLFAPNPLITILAWLLVLGGSTIIAVGLASLRWKAAAPSVQDGLVTGGIYAHVRHPLYSGMLLQLVGLALWHPQGEMLVACLIGMVWVMVQARLEEWDLIQRSPAYREYMQRVPRFVPRFKFW